MWFGAERTNKLLILMRETGAGHRASAEDICDAFQIKFGDECRVHSNSSSFFLLLSSTPVLSIVDSRPVVVFLPLNKLS